MTEELLFSPYTLGPITLKNRVVMSPMTRNRSLGNVPGENVVTYYKQRAEAGLIITEGTAPSANGLGYARIPGIYNPAQVAAWKKVTDAVHGAGGHIFVQLMHTGRVAHLANMPEGGHPVAPSAVTLAEGIWVDPDGNQPAAAPKAMDAAEIESTIEEYAHAAECAMQAGFDGVELHGANGYLIEQFLNTATNQRTDDWGGTIGGRSRFALEVARRTVARIGKDRVGIRLSPFGAFNGMVADAETVALYESLAADLSKVGLVYIHVVDHSSMGAPPVPSETKQKIHAAFNGTFILSGGYDKARAEADLQAKLGDLVAFGRPFVSNPQLVQKLAKGSPLHAPDFATLYTPDNKGYTDYPLDA
ncbi:MAG: alkene reductase [Polyangiaceae bacterium]